MHRVTQRRVRLSFSHLCQLELSQKLKCVRKIRIRFPVASPIVPDLVLVGFYTKNDPSDHGLHDQSDQGSPQGEEQEGSGEAIHLAASKGHEEVGSKESDRIHLCVRRFKMSTAHCPPLLFRLCTCWCLSTRRSQARPGQNRSQAVCVCFILDLHGESCATHPGHSWKCAALQCSSCRSVRGRQRRIEIDGRMPRSYGLLAGSMQLRSD